MCMAFRGTPPTAAIDKTFARNSADAEAVQQPVSRAAVIGAALMRNDLRGRLLKYDMVQS